MVSPFFLYLVVGVLHSFVWFSLRGGAFAAFDFACFVLMPLVMVWYYTSALHCRLRSFYIYDYKSNKRGLTTSELLAASLGAALLAVGYDAIVGQVGGRVVSIFPDVLNEGVRYEDFEPALGLGRVLVGLYLSLTAGVTEEFVFRGVFRRVLDVLRPKAPTSAYVLFSSILFGSVHTSHGLSSVLGATLDGCLFAVMYAKVGDLRPVVIAHVVVDLTHFI